MKRITSVLIIAILTLGLGISSNVSAESFSKSNNDLDLQISDNAGKVDESSKVFGREVYGLSTESSVIEPLKVRKSFSEKYSIYLSPEEEIELEERLQTQEEVIPKLKEDILAVFDQDTYLGMYIDQKNGGVVNVGIRHGEKVKNVENSIISMYSSELPIKFYEAKYSESDLDRVMDEINANIDTLSKLINIQYANVDYIDQKIVIGIKKGIASITEASKVLSDLTNQEETLYKIEFVDETYKTSEDARYTTQSPIKNGLVIGSTSGTTGNCSVGFSAIDSNSKPYIVTAAHCWDTAGTGIFQGSAYIGHVSSKIQYGNNADAVAIALNSNTLLSNQLYGSISLLKNIQVAGNDVLGESVCKSGMHGESCGVLSGKNSSGYWGSNDTWHDNLRAATYVSKQGDSGGTIYNGNTLKGVHKGSLSTNGQTYGIYSHVTNVASRLNITPVNWLNK